MTFASAGLGLGAQARYGSGQRGGPVTKVE